jgi:hypothetical protein
VEGGPLGSGREGLLATWRVLLQDFSAVEGLFGSGGRPLGRREGPSAVREAQSRTLSNTPPIRYYRHHTIITPSSSHHHHTHHVTPSIHHTINTPSHHHTIITQYTIITIHHTINTLS